MFCVKIPSLVTTNTVEIAQIPVKIFVFVDATNTARNSLKVAVKISIGVMLTNVETNCGTSSKITSGFTAKYYET